MNVKQFLCFKITILDCRPLTLFLFQSIGKVPVGLTPKVTVLLLIQTCKAKGLKADLSQGESQDSWDGFFLRESTYISWISMSYFSPPVADVYNG